MILLMILNPNLLDDILTIWSFLGSSIFSLSPNTFAFTPNPYIFIIGFTQFPSEDSNSLGLKMRAQNNFSISSFST